MSDFFVRNEGGEAPDAEAPPTEESTETFFALEAEKEEGAKGSKKNQTVPIERLHEVLRQKRELQEAHDTTTSDLATARESLAKAEGIAVGAEANAATVKALSERYSGEGGASALDYDNKFISGLEARMGTLSPEVKAVFAQIDAEIKAGKGAANVSTENIVKAPAPKADPAEAGRQTPDPVQTALLAESIDARLSKAVPGLKPAYAQLVKAEMATLDPTKLPTGDAAVTMYAGKFLKAAGFTPAEVLTVEALKAATETKPKKPNTSASQAADTSDGKPGDADEKPKHPVYKNRQEQEAARNKRNQAAFGG